MISVLVIAHEPLATALIHCTRHIYRRLPSQVAALDVFPDEDPEVALQSARDLAARINDGSGLVATKLERDDDQGEVRLEGVAQNVAAPNFTVGGVAVTTDGNTEFRDINGVTVGAAAFFQAAPGRQVKARGTMVGNAVLATRAELED